jgi:hypothetical protein
MERWNDKEVERGGEEGVIDRGRERQRGKTDRTESL